jgi:hypothetical protein
VPGDARAANDECLHVVDPDDWSWNESWFFSWIDVDGGPACTFRVGLLPNQGRAMLWCFLHVDGEWITIEESRLGFPHFELTEGRVLYDRWSLRFDWQPEEPYVRGRFAVDAIGLVRSGPRTGARVPFSIDLTYAAVAPLHYTDSSPGERERTTYPIGRFEQSLVATGQVVVDGVTHAVRAGAHRDKSWGPRDWRHLFALGDLQSEDRQLFFAGMRFPGYAGGYLRSGTDPLRHLVCVDGELVYDDAQRTVTTAKLTFEDGDGKRVDVDMTPISPSITLDIAQSCPEPEHWLYWRTLVEARVTGWDAPVRGWLEASRYGVA